MKWIEVSHRLIYPLQWSLFLSGSNGCEGSDGSGVVLQSDTRHMYVWENQRWNPLTGFTYRGLPTDRYTWSDASGRYQRTRESIRLPSRHWTWVGEGRVGNILWIKKKCQLLCLLRSNIGKGLTYFRAILYTCKLTLLILLERDTSFWHVVVIVIIYMYRTPP